MREQLYGCEPGCEPGCEGAIWVKPRSHLTVMNVVDHSGG